MKTKKLIKKLRAIGFEDAKSSLVMVLDAINFIYYVAGSDSGTFDVEGRDGEIGYKIESPSFRKILKAIKKETNQLPYVFYVERLLLDMGFHRTAGKCIRMITPKHTFFYKPCIKSNGVFSIKRGSWEMAWEESLPLIKIINEIKSLSGIDIREIDKNKDRVLKPFKVKNTAQKSAQPATKTIKDFGDNLKEAIGRIEFPSNLAGFTVLKNFGKNPFVESLERHKQILSLLSHSAIKQVNKNALNSSIFPRTLTYEDIAFMLKRHQEAESKAKKEKPSVIASLPHLGDWVVILEDVPNSEYEKGDAALITEVLSVSQLQIKKAGLAPITVSADIVIIHKLK